MEKAGGIESGDLSSLAVWPFLELCMRVVVMRAAKHRYREAPDKLLEPPKSIFIALNSADAVISLANEKWLLKSTLQSLAYERSTLTVWPPYCQQAASQQACWNVFLFCVQITPICRWLSCPRFMLPKKSVWCPWSFTQYIFHHSMDRGARKIGLSTHEHWKKHISNQCPDGTKPRARPGGSSNNLRKLPRKKPNNVKLRSA